MADFGGGELETFRAETRAWLEANYPPSLMAENARHRLVDHQSGRRPQRRASDI